MKVLYIHQHFSCASGSTGTRSYEFAKKLIACNHEPIIVCGSNAVANTGVEKQISTSRILKGNVDGISVIEVSIAYSNYDGFFARIKKFLLFAVYATKMCFVTDYDVLMATTTPLTVGIPCLFVKLFTNKPIVFEVRDLWPDLPVALGIIKNKILILLLRYFEVLCYKAAVHCIALAPGIKQGIINTGIAPQKISLIPNGCDLYLLDSDKASSKKQAFKETYFQPDDFVAIFSGAHGVANGLDVVLEVAKLLLQMQVKNIKFLFVGDGKMKPALQEYAKLHNLSNCVFLDPIPKTILFRDVLPACNLGLMILKNIQGFYNGTSPNKFFDYISVGLPVLVNYPGWLTDLIKEYNCGYSVVPADIQQFANTLILASNEKDALFSKGSRSLQLAQEKFNREILAQQFVRVLENAYASSKT